MGGHRNALCTVSGSSAGRYRVRATPRLSGPGCLRGDWDIRRYTGVFDVTPCVSLTVHELRNEIRASVGRFEREVDAQFTKEELAAIAEAVGFDVDDQRPSKQAMRAGIRRETGLDEGEEASGAALRKAELEAIAATLDEE